VQCYKRIGIYNLLPHPDSR